MKSKILEIFSSLQGEGPYAGVRQVFVRFFQCHMHCVWCDTPDSIGDGRREFKEYSLEGLWKEVQPLVSDGCHSVSLTGGEPLLQADFIKMFIPYLQRAGLKVYLETSGVLYKELEKIIRDIDIVAMDFKLPSSTRQRPFWREHEEFLRIAGEREVFVKAVITSVTDREDVLRAVEIVRRVAPETLFILQPNTFELNSGIWGKCEAFQRDCSAYLPHVKIMVQMHTLWGVR